MHSLEHTAGSVIRIWKNLWLQPRRLLRLGWRPESLQPVLCRSRCLSSQVPKPTCYWQLGNLTSASLGHLLLSSYWWKCVVQVLDLLYSNMRLVPFPLEQVPHQLSDVFISPPNQVSHKYQDLTTTLQSWGGKVRAVHIAGSYWAPGFANYLILLQVLVTPALKQLIDSKRRRRTSSLTTWPTARARKTLQLRRPCFAP